MNNQQIQNAKASLAQLAGLVGHPELRILNLAEFRACENALHQIDQFVKYAEESRAEQKEAPETKVVS